ncbi:hypothetical protein N7495_008369 [Penicillium taxi]|uniref:uncharacterized protein n=1 Tax=Penicillium taxi TaxID=168475 RepID=UPI00254534EB|nr:uncharacterized protein N7495_008369 [Penicillium taxi]KAJ5888328.1 hypothetical protein N7495_008369 [Penicillium taxi]
MSAKRPLLYHELSAKWPRLQSPIEYNKLPIPETDLDLSIPWDWGSPESAQLRAIHTLEITPENERLVRTFHPALRDQHSVFVSHTKYGPEVWLVKGICDDVQAGGRPLHPYPEDWMNLHAFTGIMTPRSPGKEEYMFQESINPRKLLSMQQLDCLRELFPTAMGDRILVSGFLVILFKSLQEIQDIYRRDWIHELGGLNVNYDENMLTASADTVILGMGVCERPEGLYDQGFLGLKIRTTDGQEAITTVTHGFVRHPSPFSLTLLFSDWLGIIKYSFDDPSQTLPYPAGYQHDLCLITDKDLPEIISPPGYPVISGWATYSAALSGSEVYAARMNPVVKKWVHLEGKVDPQAIRNATVVGTQYLWDAGSSLQTASLLWTTKEPWSMADGWSGSVLCLGRLTDKSSRALVFQNYQVECTTNITMNGRRDWIFVKGGFLLPDSVRSSEIIMGDNEQHRRRDPGTFPRRSAESAVLERRVFSAL